MVSRTSPLQQPNVENETAVGELKGANMNSRKKSPSGEVMVKRGLWVSRNKIVDSGEKENTEMKSNTNVNHIGTTISAELRTKVSDIGESLKEVVNNSDKEDMVSGFLYDRLQKEVINLRRFCEAKESNLNIKDQEIKV